MFEKLNPNWTTVPYEVSFCLWVPREPRKHWSRKRFLKWKRRFIKKTIANFRPPECKSIQLDCFHTSPPPHSNC